MSQTLAIARRVSESKGAKRKRIRRLGALPTRESSKNIRATRVQRRMAHNFEATAVPAFIDSMTLMFCAVRNRAALRPQTRP